MPRLPKYLLRSRIKRSTPGVFHENLTIEHTWNWVNGEIVVYKPIKWVPYVHEIQLIPKNALDVEIDRSSTTVKETELYGMADFSISADAGLSYKALAVNVTAKAETRIKVTLDTTETKTRREKGTLGSTPVYEVTVGMMLQVQELGERQLVNNDIWEDSVVVPPNLGIDQPRRFLHWHGSESWGDIHISSDDLANVKGLQFHDGHLFIQTLPVQNENHQISDVHVALSYSGWNDWYAYIHGEMVNQTKECEYLAWPAWTPAATFMPLEGEVVKPTK